MIPSKEVFECMLLVHDFFKDTEKTCLWFKTKNPLLGNISPERLIKLGRTKKLKQFIINLKEGNIA